MNRMNRWMMVMGVAVSGVMAVAMAAGGPGGGADGWRGEEDWSLTGGTKSDAEQFFPLSGKPGSDTTASFEVTNSSNGLGAAPIQLVVRLVSGQIYNFVVAPGETFVWGDDLGETAVDAYGGSVGKRRWATGSHRFQ